MKSIVKFLLLTVILISCQEDEPKVKEKENGKIQFSFTVKGSTGLVESEPNSIKVTVKDVSGAVVFNDVLSLTEVGDNYLSEDLSLLEGSYSITAFDVLDETNEAIFSAPLEGSDRADLVADPLNIETTVSSGMRTELTVEVVATKYNKALSFDGTDDYVNLGNIFDDIQLPVSISAWIWVDPNKTSQIPIFVSQDNPSISVYKGFHFVINPTHLFTGYGDGQGYNNPYYRRELSGVTSGQFGKWIYVSAVLRGAEDMDVYLDGVSLEKIYTGTSPNPMVSDFPDAVAKIGIWTTNDVTYHFKGMIDELKVWNRALTSEEVTFEMTNRPLGNETGLVGYWNFDEEDGDQVLDASNQNHQGVLQAGTARVEAEIPGF